MRQHLNEIADDELRGLYGIIFAAACDFSIATRDVLHKWCRERGIGDFMSGEKGKLKTSFSSRRTTIFCLRISEYLSKSGDGQPEPLYAPC